MADLFAPKNSVTLQIAKKYSANKLANFLKKASKSYYNSQRLLVDDNTYDELLELLRKKDPNNSFLSKVGAMPDGSKSKLPVFMGSLDKMRPAEIIKWHDMTEGYSITPKFDGLSGLLHYKDGILIASYTRGDGNTGQVITEKAKKIEGIIVKNSPQNIGRHPSTWVWEKTAFKIKGDVFIRGEIIMFKSIFEKYYSKEYKSPRNLAVGLINKDNTKSLDLSRLNFIAYDIEYDGAPNSHAERINLLDSLGFITAWRPRRFSKYIYIGANFHRKRAEHLSDKYFENQTRFKSMDKYKKYHLKILKKYESKLMPCHLTSFVGYFWKGSKKFGYNPELHTVDNLIRHYRFCQKYTDLELDGLVITCDNMEKFNKAGYKNGRPVLSKAMKLEREDQEGVEATVKRIKWKQTKRGIFKPVVILDSPVILGGASVKKATAFNYAFVKSQKLGPGSKIDIIRSGDVIPYIRRVKSKSKVKRPFNCPHCDTKVELSKSDLYCPNTKCPQKKQAQIPTFFNVMGVENVAETLIEKALKALNITSLAEFFYSDPDRLKRELSKVPGFKEKRANQLVDELWQPFMKEIPLEKIMHGSNLFHNEKTGLGEKRLKQILDHIGIKRVLSGKVEYKDVRIHGIGEELIQIFLDRLPDFIDFWKSIKSYLTIQKPIKKKQGSLSGKVFCFTGFRSKESEDFILTNGGDIVDSVTKKDSQNLTLFYAKPSTKTKKAEEYGAVLIEEEKTMKYLRSLK